MILLSPPLFSHWSLPLMRNMQYPAKHNTTGKPFRQFFYFFTFKNSCLTVLNFISNTKGTTIKLLHALHCPVSMLRILICFKYLIETVAVRYIF
jgi:hypothetical protein